MFAVLVHQGWSLIVRIGVVIYRENILLKVVICLENLHYARIQRGEADFSSGISLK